MQDSSTALLPSLIDRLNNDETIDRDWDFRAMKQAVIRDLEALLNTRQLAVDIAADYKEAKKSSLLYGMPDITTLNPKNPRDTSDLQRVIEQTIRLNEPRLTQVRVDWVESTAVASTLHFRIHAFMRAHPKPVAITFDTKVQTSNKEVKVAEG